MSQPSSLDKDRDCELEYEKGAIVRLRDEVIEKTKLIMDEIKKLP